jgi:hypothetical protein
MKNSAGTSRPETGRSAEQRREPRRATSGEVRFSFSEGGSKLGSREVRGQLIDSSASGFRAEHDCAELTCGQIVRFRLRAASKGKARVVWTRILGGRVETGFLILP